MELSEREQDSLQALLGVVKSTVSLVPGLGQAIAGWDAYKRSSFERSVRKVCEYLTEKVDNLEDFFRQEWLQTEEGQQFTRKVFDSALDEQLEDKQELFVNALINGVNNQNIPQLEKLKFIDMLRQLSRSALMILADMHKMFINQVRGPRRNPDPTSPFPLVDPSSIAQKLSDKYSPYLVTSAVSEMESQGLFSNTAEWTCDRSGHYMSGRGFSTGLCYTDFTARFVEFIKGNENLETAS